MFNDSRTLLFFAANALLLFLVSLANNGLSGWSIHLFIAGPMVVLPALYQRYGPALLTALLTGAWLDTAFSTPFGFFATAFAAATTLIHAYRGRFRAEHNYHPLVLAHLLNPLFFIALALVMAPGLPGSPAFWARVLADALLSQLLLAAVAAWFFNLERLLFSLFHVESEPADLPFK